MEIVRFDFKTAMNLNVLKICVMVKTVLYMFCSTEGSSD